MKKILHYKYLIIAAVFFMTPLLVWPFKSPSQKFELRKYTAMPEFTLPSLVSRKYYHQLGKHLTDRFPFKNEMTAIRGGMLISLFSSSPSERVRVGKGGYYYFNRGIELPCHTFKEEDIPVYWRNIEQFIAKGKEQNIVVRVAFAPQKPTIYPEFLSAYDFKRYTCATNNLKQFLGAKPDLVKGNFISLWSKLKAEKEKNPNKLLHHPTDTHWNEYGASFFSQKIISSLSPGLWNENDVYQKPYNHQGDLGRIMGVPLYEKSAHVLVKRSGVDLSKEKMTRAGNNYIRSFSAETNSTQKLLGKVVIVHDSFAQRTLAQLPPYFKKAVYLHHEAVGSKEAEEAIKGAKYIVVTFSERFMYKTMSDLTKTGKIYQQFFPEETLQDQ